MGKKNRGDFQNLAAKRFRDIDHVIVMSEEEVYDILQKDMVTILSQVHDYQESQDAGSYHERKKANNRKGFASYPNYTKNMFANLSAVKFFYEVAQLWDSGDMDLTKAQRNAVKLLFATAYRDTVGKNKMYPAADDVDRCTMICETFRILDKKQYKRALKLTSYLTNKQSRTQTKEETRTKKEIAADKRARKLKSKVAAAELAINLFQNPKYTARAVAREFDRRSMPEKKKYKLLKKMYGDRFLVACGSFLAVEGSSSDIVGLIRDKVLKMDKKDRTKVLRAYADDYKQFGKRNFLVDSKFYEKNKKIIKKLIGLDIGYKKAFEAMKHNNADAVVGKKGLSNAGKPGGAMTAEERLASMLK